MGLSRPVLRSPPFPGVAAERAAVSARRGGGPLDPVDTNPRRIDALIRSVVRHRVGGTFWARRSAAPPAMTVLLCPNGAGEAGSLADRALATAAPEALLALLPSAAWASDARRSLARRGIAAEIGDVDPWPLLAQAGAIHAGGQDELAFLGLLAGLAVHCHADGVLAGRGLTCDGPAVLAKPALTLAQLAGAVLIAPVRYRDCYRGGAAEAEAAAEQLGFWRGIIDANRGIAAGAGIAMWKRREVAAMLWADRPAPLRFFQRAAPAVAAAAAAQGAVAVWPSRSPDGLAEAAAAARVPLCCIEDGFVRSVGLGAACHPPLSLAVDRQGLHYDPSRPSDLETILAGADFPPDLLARAGRLADFVVGAGISKYAVGRDGPAAAPRDGRRRVLVPGQVEDDLSVKLGGGAVRGNLDLLARVRAEEPGAMLLFKPHPDVVAGLRPGHVDPADALAVADEIVGDVPMAALLDAVDTVHVLTSLAGFEALLRGREVVTHGAPFYAGWGLTRDLAGPFPRRGRMLTLAELVAATLILYPRYLDPDTGLPCPPEILLARLAEQRAPKATWLTRIRGLQGRMRQPRRLTRSAA